MERPGYSNPTLSILSLWYLIVMGGLVLLSLVLAANAGIVGLMRTALVALAFFAIGLLPINLIMRRWKTAAGMVVPLIGLIVIYAPQFVPRTQAGEANLTVLTLNIHQPGSEDALNTVAETIREIDADVVALQELGPGSRENLGSRLEDVYSYQAHYQDEAYGGSGQAILSRYPIIVEDFWKAGGPWNGNLRVEIKVGEQVITVYNVHPHPPIESGLRPEMDSHIQVLGDVLDRANGDDTPVLIVGDFNMTMQFEPYRWITADYTDAFREVGTVGFGFTHPYGLGVLPRFWRIDYVFYDEHFRGLSARLLEPIPVTDHVPLVVEMEFGD